METISSDGRITPYQHKSPLERFGERARVLSFDFDSLAGDIEELGNNIGRSDGDYYKKDPEELKEFKRIVSNKLEKNAKEIREISILLQSIFYDKKSLDQLKETIDTLTKSDK